MHKASGLSVTGRAPLVALALVLALAAPGHSGEVRQLGMYESKPGPAPGLQADANTIKLRSGRLTVGGPMTPPQAAQASRVAQDATSALGATPKYLYYLVHVPRRAGYWDAQTLGAAGFPVMHTVPENTMVVRCPVSQVRRMTAVIGADFVTPLTAAQKTAPGFTAPSAQARTVAGGEQICDLAGVLVRLFPGENPEPVAARFRSLGINVLSVIPDRGVGAELHLMTTGGPYPMIPAHPAVQWVEEEPRLTTNNDILTGETAIGGDTSRGLINVYDATHHATKPVTGSGQIVGHIDSGVDRGADGGGTFHEDLDGKVTGAGLIGRTFGIFYDYISFSSTGTYRTAFREDAQNFTSNWTGGVSSVRVILTKFDAPDPNPAWAGNIYINLRAWTSTKPGAILTNGTSAAVDASTIPRGSWYVDFPFATAPSLTRDTQYFVSVNYRGVNVASNNRLGIGSYDAAGNTAYYYYSTDGSTWSSLKATAPWYRLIGDGSTAHWLDLMGHGTHTAGTICGTGSDIAARRGVSYGAALVHRAAGTGAGSGISIPDLSAALTAMHTAGARIYSNSWGGGTNGQYDSQAVTVDTFMWNNPGDLICFSAGNNGADAGANGKIDPNSIGPPGTAKNCLTVGNAESYRTTNTYAWSQPANAPFLSTYQTRQTDSYASAGIGQGLCPSSSRGTMADARVKPEVVAPGWLYSTRSAYDNVTDGAPIDGTWPGGGYRVMNGTSMACPAVAGAAALVRQYLVTYRGYTNPTAALIKAILIAGADNLTPGQYGTGANKELYDNAAGTGSPDYAQGYGRINVAKSLGMLDTLVRGWYQSPAPLTDTTTAQYVTLRAASSTPISGVLVWTDYPGAALAAQPIVNDLDLQIRTGYTGVKDSGAIAAQCLRPIDEQTGSDPGEGDDDVNTVEKCVVASPTAGTNYTFQVSAETLGHSGQQFALLITGDFDQWLPVTVRSFETQATSLGARLQWELAEGPDFVGCHVYRAASPQGPFTKITDRMLAPDHAGYSFTDAEPNRRQHRAYYRIVGVRSNGETEEQDSPPFAVELPAG